MSNFIFTFSAYFHIYYLLITLLTDAIHPQVMKASFNKWQSNTLLWDW